MKIRLYKCLFTFLTIGFIGVINAQKVNKKFTESFSVNKDVKIAINATNTDIDVTTWDKNEVSVEAFIEVEGLSKEEAEKYLKNYNFEALGNKSKVQITSGGTNFIGLHDNFVIFNDNNNNNFNFPNVVIPDMDSLRFPEINIDAIVIPDINLENITFGLEDFDFDFDKYAKDGEKYFFQWKDSAKSITIKSKEEWEKFKKTKEYKKLKEEIKLNKEKMKKELEKAHLEYKKINKAQIKESLEKAKLAYEKIDKVKIREEVNKARKEVAKLRENYFFDSNSNDLIINDKKVKITKKMIIKVPKDATFDLNTRHSKVKLPKTKVSGKVSYGSFDANEINGGKLNISFSPVNINSLNACTLFLNNVTDAKIASVTNTTLTSNSGDLKINEVFKDVNIESSFSELYIEKVNSNFGKFNLVLKQSEAVVNLSNIKEKLSFNVKEKSPQNLAKPSMTINKNKSLVNGNFTATNKSKSINIEGKYSQLTIHK